MSRGMSPGTSLRTERKLFSELSSSSSSLRYFDSVLFPFLNIFFFFHNVRSSSFVRLQQSAAKRGGYEGRAHKQGFEKGEKRRGREPESENQNKFPSFSTVPRHLDLDYRCEPLLKEPSFIDNFHLFFPSFFLSFL